MAGALLCAGVGRGADVDAERIRGAEASSWLTHGRDYAEQRFSPLEQIHRGNVGELGLAWSFETGTLRGLEATPLVVDGVLYTTGTWSVVYALDAATGAELWRYDPKVPREAARKACCDVVNRGVAVWKGRVFVGTLDGRLLALDARTGKRMWEVTTVDRTRYYTITGAPRIVKGKVIIGNGGAEFGVRGYFSAYDTETGALLWRFYTVPGPPSRPFEHPELAIAARTWSPDSRWETGLGGTVWDSMAYDPELDLLYVGVGNSSPYNRDVRSPGGGDNLFLTSILAVRPDTGRLVWHYQTTPGESWDYTATQHMILADLTIDGSLRKVLMQAPKNGFFYVLDRQTGELLSAENYVPVSWASHVDLATGRPVETDAGWARDRASVTPGPPGGHNWHPMSYSPKTGLVYIPAMQVAYPYFPDRRFVFRLGEWNTGEHFPSLQDYIRSMPDFQFCAPTQLLAWDPVRQREAWRVDHSFFTAAGVLSTAGGLVFQGTESRFVAYSDESGEPLWEADVGVGITAPPITYRIDGVQYVAVMAGLGGGSLVVIPSKVVNEGRLLAFRIGGNAPMPPARPKPAGVVDAPPSSAPPQTVARGKALYADHCMFCHGFGVRNGGLMPDLRHSTRAVHDGWQDIVLGGTRTAGGMASFADVLDPEDVAAIHAYVLQEAHRQPTLLGRAGAWLAERICVPISLGAD